MPIRGIRYVAFVVLTRQLMIDSSALPGTTSNSLSQPKPSLVGDLQTPQLALGFLSGSVEGKSKRSELWEAEPPWVWQCAQLPSQ